MAGASSRFINEGYKPKYMLELTPGYTLFDAAVKSFEEFFGDAIFLFVTNSLEATLWVESRLSKLDSLKDYKIVTLDGVTKGQAETVYLGLKESYKDLILYENMSAVSDKAFYDKYKNLLVIFNIDTIRHNFKRDLDAFLESYCNLSDDADISNIALFDAIYDTDADQSKWSFCMCQGGSRGSDKLINRKILKTAEKEKIGPWCSTGLYIFPSVISYFDIYIKAATAQYGVSESTKVYDYYIAPLYNVLIDDKFQVGLTQDVTSYVLECDRDDVEFAGVPADYERLKSKYVR